MSTDLTVVKFSAVVSSPGSRQESSRVSSCSCRDQSTGHRYQVEYRSDGYETSVQEGPTLILHLLVQGEKSSSDTKIRECEVEERDAKNTYNTVELALTLC